MTISTETIESLVQIITGESGISPSRTGPQLVEFFRSFGERDLSIQANAKHKTMPYRCPKSKEGGCGRFLSVNAGTFTEASNLGYQDWLYALFLIATSLNSVSSVNLHRDTSVTQRTSWHMAHRIRKALGMGSGTCFLDRWKWMKLTSAGSAATTYRTPSARD